MPTFTTHLLTSACLFQMARQTTRLFMRLPATLIIATQAHAAIPSSTTISKSTYTHAQSCDAISRVCLTSSHDYDVQQQSTTIALE